MNSRIFSELFLNCFLNEWHNSFPFHQLPSTCSSKKQRDEEQRGRTFEHLHQMGTCSSQEAHVHRTKHTCVKLHPYLWIQPHSSVRMWCWCQHANNTLAIQHGLDAWSSIGTLHKHARPVEWRHHRSPHFSTYSSRSQPCFSKDQVSFPSCVVMRFLNVGMMPDFMKNNANAAFLSSRERLIRIPHASFNTTSLDRNLSIIVDMIRLNTPSSLINCCATTTSLDAFWTRRQARLRNYFMNRRNGLIRMKHFETAFNHVFAGKLLNDVCLKLKRCASNPNPFIKTLRWFMGISLLLNTITMYGQHVLGLLFASTATSNQQFHIQ